jgi:hypothetical protein
MAKYNQKSGIKGWPEGERPKNCSCPIHPVGTIKVPFQVGGSYWIHWAEM